VGAVVILMVRVAMQSGFRFGFMAGAGAATADLLYAIAAAVTGAALAAVLEPSSTELRILSALVLVALAGFGGRPAGGY